MQTSRPTPRKLTAWQLIAVLAVAFVMWYFPAQDQAKRSHDPDAPAITVPADHTDQRPQTKTDQSADTEIESPGSLPSTSSTIDRETKIRVPADFPPRSGDSSVADQPASRPQPTDVKPTQSKPTESMEPDRTPVTKSNETPATSERKEFLEEVSRGVFESPAGLIYRSGSADGHRIDHVLTHASDIPSKPIHGVFDGTRDEVFALIDEAWEIAQKRGPPDVKTEQNRDRTVYIVDMKRKIGYVGGQSGKRQGHPACRKLQLVVEDREVITAYPAK